MLTRNRLNKRRLLPNRELYSEARARRQRRGSAGYRRRILCKSSNRPADPDLGEGDLANWTTEDLDYLTGVGGAMAAPELQAKTEPKLRLADDWKPIAAPAV